MRLSKFGVVVLAIIMIFNSVVILRSLDLISLPGEITSLDMARAGTNAMLSYLRKYASDMGVDNNNAVKESIGLLQYKIETAKSEEELAQVIMIESRLVQETIVRETENRRNQIILNIISKDQNLQFVQEKETIVVWGDNANGVQIRDGSNVLQQDTITELRQSKDLQTTFSEVAVTVEAGVPKVLTYRRLYDRLGALESEVARLQHNLIEKETFAGYRQMMGEGLIISVYDAEGGYQEDEIVHDVDVRDMLNELFSAGAIGASVGGQRVINTTAIRCIGPVILVNYEPISVDPVVIKVVGDPTKLNSGLELMKNTLETIKGIRVDVQVSDNIILPAYNKATS